MPSQHEADMRCDRAEEIDIFKNRAGRSYYPAASIQ